MNEKESILKTYCMWSWLSKFPSKDKKDYPLFFELNYDSVILSCYLCEYSWNIELSCKNCLLYKKCNKCENDNSLYKKWCKYIDRSTNAGNIASLCWERYKELGG